MWMFAIQAWWEDGGVDIGRRGVILKVINNIAKTHAGSLDPVIGRVGVRYKWRRGIFHWIRR